MHKLLALLSVFVSPALAQTPAGVINAPIYATGYISQVGGTNVTTNIPPQPNHPTNLNIYTTGAISGTWTIKLPNPAFEGQMLSFNCGAAANAISVTSSDGSSIDSTIPSTCSINSGFTIQFDQRSNIWRNIGSNNTSTFKPFTGTASQWPWQLNADGTWTLKALGQGTPNSLVALSVLDYGAVADGNIANATANVTAINTIIASGRCAFLPYTTAGYHFGAQSVTVSTGACIVGENDVKIQYSGSTSPFKITAYTLTGGRATISNLTIDMAAASAGSSAIRNMLSLGNVAGVKIKRITCLNAYSCIDDDNSAASPPAYVSDEEWDDIHVFLTRGRSFTVNHSRGFMYFRNIRIDETVTGQVAPITWSGGLFADFIGLEFGRFDRVGNGGSLVYQSTNKCIEITGQLTPGSLSIPGYASVWVLDRLLCDGTSGDGPAFTNVAYLQATAIETYGALGNGVLFYNVQSSNITNLVSTGDKGGTGAAAGANGFTCNFCDRVNIANLLTNDNTGTGASIINTTNTSIVNHSANNNGTYALMFIGTTGTTKVMGGAWTSNVGTLLDISSGGGNQVRNISGYNPRGVDTITVGASPFTYTAGTSPETIYMRGGTVSSVAQDVLTMATASPGTFHLEPNESIVVTYTVAPTMNKMIH